MYTIQKLYHYYRSSCSWRVRWALEIKDLKPTLESVNLLSGEQNGNHYKKIQPRELVPAIKIGGETFGESLAILEWLEETYPKPSLLPTTPLDRLRVREMMHIIASGIQPLQNLKNQKEYSKSPSEQREYCHRWIGRGLASYEKICEKVSGSYSYGSSLTLSDICLIPQVYNAYRFGYPVEKHPIISRIYNKCSEEKACKASSPHHYMP